MVIQMLEKKMEQIERYIFMENNEFILSFLSKDERDKYKKKYEKSIHSLDKIMQSYINNECTKHEPPTVVLKWNDLDNINKNHSYKEGDKYYIELYLYVPINLERYLKDKNCDTKYIDCIVNIVIQEIYLHEYFHILFGHCTISEDEKIPTEIQKQMEYACDMKALHLLFTEMDISLMTDNGNLGIYISYFSTILASLFIYFNMVEKDEIYDMEQNKGTEKYRTFTDNKRKHPFITFRFEYMRFLVEKHLLETLKHFGTEYCIDLVFKNSYEIIINCGIENGFEIDPFWRRNRNELKRIYNINFDDINKYCKEIYIDDLM